MKRRLVIWGLALAMLASACSASGGDGGSPAFGQNILYTRASADDEAVSQSPKDEDAVPDDESVSLSGLRTERTKWREELTPESILEPIREMPIIQIDGSSYVGYVDIPALDLSLTVMAVWSYPNLKISPCRYTGSVYYDNMVIMAHNYQRHFGRLKDLEIGDEVRFTDGDGNVFVFQVSAMEVLNPSQVEEMTKSIWDLTLFTCTVGGEQRVTVRCTRVSEEPAE